VSLPGKNPRKKLSDRQKRYVDHYLACLEGKLAAERAGYSKRSAAVISYSLQRQPVVRKAIEEGLAEREVALKDMAIDAMAHTYSQATTNLTDLLDDDGAMLPLSKISEKAKRAIQSIEVETRWDGRGEDAVSYKVTKVKIHDKCASQRLFAQYAGKLKDRVELDATKGFEAAVLEAERLRRERKKAAAGEQPEGVKE
jgi:phage terminase small subunit